MTIQRTTTRITAALALLASAMAAQAGPITVDFTVTSNDVSNPAWERGVTGSGYFTLDDALMPVSGNGLVGNPIAGLPTLDLFFTWFGVSFDETTARIGTLSFTDEDLGAIFAYLRSIPPIKNRVPEPLPPGATAAVAEK